MQPGTKRAITRNTSDEIIRREIGIKSPNLETLERGKEYECFLGNCWANVRYDEDRGAIHFRICRSGSPSINTFYDPVTLEENYGAQLDYEQEIKREIREGG